MAMSPEHHAKRAEHHAGEARKHAQCKPARCGPHAQAGTEGRNAARGPERGHEAEASWVIRLRPSLSKSPRTTTR